MKYIEIEIDKIPGRQIPYLKDLLTLLHSKGYILREFSVNLRNYMSEDLKYVELKEYSGQMHGINGKVFFESSIPLTRIKEFGFEG